jgi:outer membrane protein
MKKLFTAVAVLALATPLLAQNAPMRVAVIDVQRVLATSTPGKAAYERLKKMQDDRMARAAKMDEEVKSLENDMNSKKLSLSEDKVTEMAKTISEKRINMQRYAQDADREVTESRDKELAALEAKIKPVIDSIGKEMGLAAIFNKFESGLVYASEAIDITEPVIKRFDEVSGGAAAAPKKP